VFEDIPKFKSKPYRLAPELLGVGEKSYPVIIVGSGPVGLTLALDLARKGHQITIVTAAGFIARESKAICIAKQGLDIFDRLGVGERMVEKGVIWNVGKVFHGNADEPIHQFDMLPVKDQKNPGFINIQQYYLEDYLCDALEAMDNVDIRWGHKVSDVRADDEDCLLTVETQDGSYQMRANYVLACDGSNSTIRRLLGLDFEGQVFEDNFLIADVRFKQSRPSERWFWFDPPFNPGKSALLHKQPDDVWRMDFQLGWDIDRAAAVRPENVEPYIRGMLGEDIDFEKEWYSVYTFRCCRMRRFVHGRVIFLGDSAHLVSPFGARGANSGIADADNLGWKLDLILNGQAGMQLLETYNDERTAAADVNIAHSTRATDFITPKNTASHDYRDGLLELAETCPFARETINSGRLYTAAPYVSSTCTSPDADACPQASPVSPAPGAMALDGPVSINNHDAWLFDLLDHTFCLLYFGHDQQTVERLRAFETTAKSNVPAVQVLQVQDQDCVDTGSENVLIDTSGLLRQRYASQAESLYLLRPDRYVAARFQGTKETDIMAALRNAIGQ